MPISPSAFRTAWWLPGPHLQTLWPSLFRPRPELDLTPRRLELPDGDFLDLAFGGEPTGPLVLVLHGLEGSLQSHYAGNLLAALGKAGFRTCFMHFRGCSGEPNRLPRGYHSGETSDLQTVVDWLEGNVAPVDAAIGFSLGGNVLLKWLGECGADAAVRRAVAVSVPFVLADADRRLQRGASRIYQHHLMQRLRESYRTKFARIPSPLEVDVDHLRTFRDFDENVTAPLHGFAGADDYYSRSSSRQYLRHIERPVLILHALDDPFMWPDSVPDETELSPTVTLELARHGGHVGFVSGTIPGRARYWLDHRIVQWLTENRPL